MGFDSIPQMFFANADRWAERPRYRHRLGESWHEVSWRESARAVRETAAGLLELGVGAGTKIGLLCSTRPEWTETDLAVLSCRAITVPIYPSLLSSECAYILADSEASLCIVENEKQLAKVREAMEKGAETGEKPILHRVVLIDGEPDSEDCIGLRDLRVRGREALGRLGRQIDNTIAQITRDEIATIVYTSGTTGLPKGVVQTHGNHLAALESVAKLGLAREGEVDFLFLPLAHSFARMLEYFGLYAGTVTAFARSIETVAQDMIEAKPNLIPSVPRIFEKVYSRIMAARDASSLPKRMLFDWALRVGKQRSEYIFARRPVPLLLDLQFSLARALVFSKIGEALGGRVKLLVSGGAPLAREILDFFTAAGFVLVEGYGLTETTPILTANRPDNIKLGTVGQPIDGVELKIAEDGEILAKGPNIALGYYKRPEATAEVWDSEGWFHTGDIGELDSERFLRITDRKKDLIKTSGGKYVAPQKIENMLKTQPFISQAVVIGDNRKYCVALLTLDVEEVRRWARENGVGLPQEKLWQDSRVHEEVSRQVAAVNCSLASYETIKYFRLLPQDFSAERGELTPSLKVKRKVVAERYRALVEEMFA